MKNDIDNSRQRINKTLMATMICSLLIPLLLFSYFKIGERKFVYNKIYEKVYTGESPKKVKLNVKRKPLTNVNSVEAWLRVSLIDLLKTNQLNYKSAERWEKFKKYFAPSIARNVWDLDIIRVEQLLSETFNLTNATIKNDPLFLGSAVSGKGEALWRFYVEVATESFSQNIKGSSKRTMKILVIIKEMKTSDDYSGISIVDIEIK